MNNSEGLYTADENNAFAQAIADELYRKQWDALIAANKAKRRAMPVEDQVLSIDHPLQLVQAGVVHGGRSAWLALFATLSAFATLEEVTRVAPQFEDHIRAAAECLLPFIRSTPVGIDVPFMTNTQRRNVIAAACNGNNTADAISRRLAAALPSLASPSPPLRQDKPNG